MLNYALDANQVVVVDEGLLAILLFFFLLLSVAHIFALCCLTFHFLFTVLLLNALLRLLSFCLTCSCGLF